MAHIPDAPINDSEIQRSADGLSYFEFNPEDYRHLLEGEGLTREQATEFLQTVFLIVHYCIDLGLELDPVSLIFNEMEDRDGTSE
jgi:hypothetical protein